MRKYLVELVGTFFLTLAVSLTADPMAIGLMLVALIYMGGHISGGHYNPAITTAVRARGSLSMYETVRYGVVQVIGALFAGTLFFFLSGNFLIIRLPAEIPVWIGMLPEFMFTFLFCSVALVALTTDRLKGTGVIALAIGLTLLAIAFFGGVYNPAIGFCSLVCGLLQGDTASAVNNLIAHILAPLAGALLAAVWFKYTNEPYTNEPYTNPYFNPYSNQPGARSINS